MIKSDGGTEECMILLKGKKDLDLDDQEEAYGPPRI
jgi:hypothetical protein